MSAGLPPDSRHCSARLEPQKSARNGREQTQQIAPLFNHLIELGTSLACIGADSFREQADANPELGPHLVEHCLHDRRHASQYDHVADPKLGAPDTSLRTRSAPLGMRVIRMRASLIWAPVALATRTG